MTPVNDMDIDPELGGFLVWPFKLRQVVPALDDDEAWALIAAEQQAVPALDDDIDMDSGTVWTGAPVPALDDDAAWAVLDAELQVWIDAG